jgi:transposase
MSKTIMIGCDLHDRSMLLRYGVDDREPQQASFANDEGGRMRMIERLQQFADRHKAKRIVFVYEASGQGYGLCDLLHDHGIECHVLSPTHLPKTPKGKKQKTDVKDAQMLLEQVRGHVLAGNRLPVVWTPPQRLRDDRELVRARIDAADETTRVKLQILSMLKRRGIAKPAGYSSTWSKRFVAWLRQVAQSLDSAVTPVLESLLARYELQVAERARLDRAIVKLSQTDRYRVACQELRRMPGVGLLSAMTFLTEMGDLQRFHNRREIAAYLGLCPASAESGEVTDRKGRITRQGPARLRKVLCQAAWISLRYCPEAAAAYGRIRGGKSNRTKKALVAVMRRLAIRMWHRALSCGVDCELEGRGGPHASPPTPPPKSPQKKSGRRPVTKKDGSDGPVLKAAAGGHHNQ